MLERKGRIRRWLSSLKQREELNNLEPAELSRIAGDAGVSVGELKALQGTGTDSADLLPRRLDLVGIDRAQLAHNEPAVLRDLERVCSFCGDKAICRHDIDREQAGDGWESYCPNAATLRSLRRPA
jgi:hypothetical protein